jgi:uncharacterized protein YkwD
MAPGRSSSNAYAVIGSFRAARLAVCVAVVAGAVALAAPAVLARPAPHRAPAVALTSLEFGVLADINAFRAAHHLHALSLSTELTSAARQHSREMAADGYFAHNSVGGSVFWKRIRRYYPSSSWSFWSVGENLLWSSATVTAADALKMWEASPEHLANMLTPRWREIGVSAVRVDLAPGIFHGLDVTIITTDFGVRG